MKTCIPCERGCSKCASVFYYFNNNCYRDSCPTGSVESAAKAGYCIQVTQLNVDIVYTGAYNITQMSTNEDLILRGNIQGEDYDLYTWSIASTNLLA